MGRLSDYDFLETLGSGTYGRVYKVRRRSDAHILVLKQVPLSNLTPHEQQETLNESKLMSQVNHERVIKYHESFIEDISVGGKKKSLVLNIIMDHAEGGDLAQKIRQQKEEKQAPFAERTLWTYLIQITEGLKHLHGKRILHRDIKAQNIFLDHDGNVMIGDLGLGRLLGPHSAFARSAVGTPLYFSPELCEERSYNEKSDIWSLGCLMYELSTFHPPFLAQNQLALARKIVSQNPEQPLPREYSMELHFLVFKMLEKDMQMRPDTNQILNYSPVRIRIYEEDLRQKERRMDVYYKKFEAELLKNYQQKCDQVEVNSHALSLQSEQEHNLTVLRGKLRKAEETLADVATAAAKRTQVAQEAEAQVQRLHDQLEEVATHHQTELQRLHIEADDLKARLTTTQNAKCGAEERVKLLTVLDTTHRQKITTMENELAQHKETAGLAKHNQRQIQEILHEAQNMLHGKHELNADSTSHFMKVLNRNYGLSPSCSPSADQTNSADSCMQKALATPDPSLVPPPSIQRMRWQSTHSSGGSPPPNIPDEGPPHSARHSLSEAEVRATEAARIVSLPTEEAQQRGAPPVANSASLHTVHKQPTDTTARLTSTPIKFSSFHTRSPSRRQTTPSKRGNLDAAQTRSLETSGGRKQVSGVLNPSPASAMGAVNLNRVAARRTGSQSAPTTPRHSATAMQMQAKKENVEAASNECSVMLHEASPEQKLPHCKPVFSQSPHIRPRSKQSRQPVSSGKQRMRYSSPSLNNRGLEFTADQFDLCPPAEAHSTPPYSVVFAWRRVPTVSNASNGQNSSPISQKDSELIQRGKVWPNRNKFLLLNGTAALLIVYKVNSSLSVNPAVKNFKYRLQGEEQCRSVNSHRIQQAGPLRSTSAPYFVLPVPATVTGHRLIVEFILEFDATNPLDELVILPYSRRFLQQASVRIVSCRSEAEMVPRRNRSRSVSPSTSRHAARSPQLNNDQLASLLVKVKQYEEENSRASLDSKTRQHTNTDIIRRLF